MNFQFEYVLPEEQIQGSTVDNESEFTGGLGMVQNREADFFLGDVSLSSERRQAVEFTFFTLADSGAFVTHAPRILSEAFVILRPFKIDVWPYVIFTVIVSGPVLYFIIIIPKLFHRIPKDMEIYPEYISEITGYGRNRKLLKIQEDELPMPKDLFDKCIWFTLQLFLKQCELSSTLKTYSKLTFFFKYSLLRAIPWISSKISRYCLLDSGNICFGICLFCSAYISVC